MPVNYWVISHAQNRNLQFPLRSKILLKSNWKPITAANNVDKIHSDRLRRVENVLSHCWPICHYKGAALQFSKVLLILATQYIKVLERWWLGAINDGRQTYPFLAVPVY